VVGTSDSVQEEQRIRTSRTIRCGDSARMHGERLTPRDNDGMLLGVEFVTKMEGRNGEEDPADDYRMVVKNL